MIERLTAENAALREKVPQWISVEERRPEPGKRVLATDGVFVGEAYRWMPLPEAQEAHNGKENS